VRREASWARKHDITQDKITPPVSSIRFHLPKPNKDVVNVSAGERPGEKEGDGKKPLPAVAADEDVSEIDAAEHPDVTRHNEDGETAEKSDSSKPVADAKAKDERQSDSPTPITDSRAEGEGPSNSPKPIADSTAEDEGPCSGNQPLDDTEYAVNEGPQPRLRRKIRLPARYRQ